MRASYNAPKSLCLALSLSAMVLLNFSCSSGSKLSGGVQSAKAAEETSTKKNANDSKTDVANSAPAATSTPTTTAEEPTQTPEVVAKPVVDGAIQKGSFTVWTEPKDPKAFQDYIIFVQVTLPANTSNYSLADLDGNLVGTDGYEQSFGGSIKPAHFEVNGDSATVQIKVPGSFFLVRDTIDVHSDLLNEQQEIAIVF